MNTENMINITGVDLAKVVQEAYRLSTPQGLGFLHFQEGGLTDEEAASLIAFRDPRTPLTMDYVRGRACKLTVFKEGKELFIQNFWYDHSDEQLKELLEAIGVSVETPT